MTTTGVAPERRRSDTPRALAIRDTVVAMLVDDGYDALQLRDVARRAQVSLRTIYLHYPSRDDLVVAAVEHWMSTHVYSQLPTPLPGASLCDSLTRLFRYLLRAWERQPEMLTTYLRAATGPGGERLVAQGQDAFQPALRDLFDGYAADFTDDVLTILGDMIFGLLSRFAAGRLRSGDIVIAMERTIFRLTADAQPDH